MILKIKEGIFNEKLLKFLLVGVLNTVFGYSMFSLFIWLNIHYALAIAYATILGTLFNFKTIGTLVFLSKDNSKIFKFLLVYFIVYILNIVGMYLLLKMSSNKYINGIILVIPLALISYFLNSKFVFKNKNE